MDKDGIKALREALNMNRVQFAARLGVHPITVKRWEDGAKPSALAMEKLEKIAKRMQEKKSNVGA